MGDIPTSEKKKRKFAYFSSETRIQAIRTFVVREIPVVVYFERLSVILGVELIHFANQPLIPTNIFNIEKKGNSGNAYTFVREPEYRRFSY